jgi:hypothetical protein
VPEVVISPVAKALTLVRGTCAAGFGITRVIVLEGERQRPRPRQCRMLALFSWPAIQRQSELPMKHDPFPAKNTFLTGAVMLVGLALLLAPTSAQTPHKNDASNDAQNHARSGTPTGVQLELVRIETGFFEAWKTKDQTYFREHMPENGIFWGETGTVSREQRLAEQQASAKACTVEGYGLSDFGALPLAAGAYLLTYKAEQYATCSGEKVPVHLNGSSIYIFKAGRWQAIYRAEVPLKNPS